MTIEEAIAWLHERLAFGTRPGLERVEALLERVGHPEKNLPTIHVAGTNGKGSTITYLRCMLEAAGLNVGTFTSPYIEVFNERLAINGQMITDETLIQFVKKYQSLVEKMDQEEAIAGITEFELLTVMGLEYFNDQSVDIALIEVGLGGRLDSTNVVQPMLTAITTIGNDHMDILGDTLEAIAFQKAGIIKAGIPVVTGTISEEIVAGITEIARQQKSPVYRYGQDYQAHYLHPDKQWGEVFDFYGDTGKLPALKTPLLGKHQTENAAVAIELFYLYCQQQRLPFDYKTVSKGLLAAKWPARMERINQNPLIILDGAHNVPAIERLVENIKAEFSEYTIHILFSALATKNIEEMMGLLKRIPRARLYITTFDYPTAVNLNSLQLVADQTTEIVSLWQFGAGEILEKMTEENELLLVTGSLYFVSQVRQLFATLGGTLE